MQVRGSSNASLEKSRDEEEEEELAATYLSVNAMSVADEALSEQQ